MNKFILISVCALMALASAQEAAAPAAMPGALLLATVQHGVQALRPENICSPSCGAVCTATSTFCINVPGFVDCSKTKAQCDGLCASGCGCLTSCRTGCETNHKCTAVGAANLMCQAQLNTCVVVCQATCPAQTSFGIFQQTLQASFKQFQALLSSFKAPETPE